MSLSDELAFTDATEQAELVRSGQLTALELIDAALGRAESVDPSLNAVVTPMYDIARRAAGGLLPEGPFTGVPFLLKDLFASYEGVRMTWGSRFLADNVATHDSELVLRQKQAGLITIGKTNTPEFGILCTTEPELFGPCRNPWDTQRSTGGSSGGSAAAVAAGIVPMAHANDAGGSIRIPASCCGVFGMKPTRARNPMGPDVGDVFGGFVVEHAVTRSVRDSAALLDATAGPSLGDPYCAPAPARSFVEEVGADPGRLRIAFITEAPTGVPVHEDCVAAVREAASLCEELGHEVVEGVTMDYDINTIVQSFMAIYAAGNAWGIDASALLAGREPARDQFEPLTWALYEMGRQVSAPSYLMAMTSLQMASRLIAGAFEPYDAVLTPTIPEPPPPLGTFDSPPDNPLAGLMRASLVVPFTSIANFTGLPAMSVPLYWSGDGLPIGTMFYGRFGDEGTLFRLAAQLEEARPWSSRRPPVSA
jgi:amidase